MGNSIERSWTSFVDAVGQHVPNIQERVLPRHSFALTREWQKEFEFFPTQMVEFYRLTDGLRLSGYLPDVYSETKELTFSIIPAEEMAGFYMDRMEQSQMLDEPGILVLTPLWFRVLRGAMWDTDVWQDSWFPFAWDGGGDLHFISALWPHNVFQYNHELRGVKRIARTLPGYFRFAEKVVRHGNEVPLDLEAQ